MLLLTKDTVLAGVAWGTNQDSVVAHGVIVNRMDTSTYSTHLAWIRERVSSLRHILLMKHSNKLGLITGVPQGYVIRTLSMISDISSSSCFHQSLFFKSANLTKYLHRYLYPSIFLSLSFSLPKPRPFLFWLTEVPTACLACSKFYVAISRRWKRLHFQALMPLHKEVPIPLTQVQIPDLEPNLTKILSKD